MPDGQVLHGLIQKALRDASELHTRQRVDATGQVWAMGYYGWAKTGQLADPQDREDFLVGKLTQEDR